MGKSMDRGQTSEDSLQHRKSNDMEIKNAIATRKVLKADRERLRRDKLNEHFLELGTLLDLDKPKNNKRSIIAETIQMLKDLNSQVKKLKADHALLSQESRELAQEKSELREEKASLKANIHHLNQQQQQQQRNHQTFMVPWASVNSSILMAPSYPFVPLPLYANQHCPTSPFIPYLAPVIPQINRSTLNASTSYISGPTASTGKSIDEQISSTSRTSESGDVATDLELKIPGSATSKGLSTKEKGKQPQRHQEKIAKDGSSLSKSPSQSSKKALPIA